MVWMVVLYITAIVAANFSVWLFGPVSTPVNAFLFIGLDFIVRDKLQDLWTGRHLFLKMAALIVGGSVITFLLNPQVGRIAVASCVAFAASSTVDWGVYTLIRKKPWMVRANVSNIFAAATDSVLFPTLAFGAFMPFISLGQWAAKVFGGFIWSWAFAKLGRRESEEAVALPPR